MEKITLKINGQDVEAEAGSTILEAARAAGIDIPTLCYLKGVNQIGACRMCVVEVKNARTLMAACMTAATPDMEVWTESERVVESRRRTLSLLCASHHLDCEYCPRYSDCELHALFVRYGIRAKKLGAFAVEPDLDKTAPHLVRDANRCLLCRRCVAACHAQGVDAIAVLGRGQDARVGAPLGLGTSNCIHCGQCVAACPTGALFERDETHALRCALEYKDKHAVAIVEPPVWAALGEAFQEPLGVNVRGKLAAFLRRVGFELVFDLSREPDGRWEELRAHLRQGGQTPLVSAVCPAFSSYCEQNRPAWDSWRSRLPHPAAAAAGDIRARSAKRLGVAEKDITVVSISACTAQKAAGPSQVDYAITVRELVKLLRTACVSLSTSLDVWRSLSEELYDNESSDTRPFLPLPAPNGGAVEAVLERDGVSARACVVSGLKEGLRLLEDVQNGRADYDYIEVRACPGGCLAGGGQPRHSQPLQNEVCAAAERRRALQG